MMFDWFDWQWFAIAFAVSFAVESWRRRRR